MQNTLQDLPRWDLSDLFNSHDDPRIKETLKNCAEMANIFDQTYRNKINNDQIDSALIAKALDDFESITCAATKTAVYAELAFSSNTADPANGILLRNVQVQNEAISRRIMFFELELMELSDQKLSELMNDERLKNRLHYLSVLKNKKAHRLTEAEEKIISLKSLTGNNAFERLFEQEFANKAFKIPGEEKDLTESEILNLLYHPDRATRYKAAQGITQGLAQDIRRLSFIYNTLIQDKNAEDELRKFEYPEASRHLSNEIPKTSVEALDQAVSQSFSIVEDFYNYKKQLLGLEELFDYDRYAPLAEESMIFSYEEAKEIVLKAYQEFNPQFAEIAQMFFDNNWIDAGVRPGKRSGAFCSFVTPDLHPYVLLNYLGGARDVMTMAHELGHAIHAYLARGQNLLDFHASLPVCETASIFGEMLVFEDLKKRLKNNLQALKSLYIQKIEEIFASVYRQMAMYRFEHDVHLAVQKKGELEYQEINAIWYKHQQEMFGKSVTLTPGYAYWWSYIPHFISTPFYVYAYAFGELLTLSVFAQYKQQGSAMVMNYLEALKAGGSKTPAQIASQLGLNINDPKCWQNGLQSIKNMVEEVKNL